MLFFLFHPSIHPSDRQQSQLKEKSTKSSKQRSNVARHRRTREANFEWKESREAVAFPSVNPQLEEVSGSKVWLAEDRVGLRSSCKSEFSPLPPAQPSPTKATYVEWLCSYVALPSIFTQSHILCVEAVCRTYIHSTYTYYIGTDVDPNFVTTSQLHVFSSLWVGGKRKKEKASGDHRR